MYDGGAGVKRYVVSRGVWVANAVGPLDSLQGVIVSGEMTPLPPVTRNAPTVCAGLRRQGRMWRPRHRAHCASTKLRVLSSLGHWFSKKKKRKEKKREKKKGLWRVTIHVVKIERIYARTNVRTSHAHHPFPLSRSSLTNKAAYLYIIKRLYMKMKITHW